MGLNSYFSSSNSSFVETSLPWTKKEIIVLVLLGQYNSVCEPTLKSFIDIDNDLPGSKEISLSLSILKCVLDCVLYLTVIYKPSADCEW